MALTIPTDAMILDLLKDGTRHTPVSVAYELHEVSRQYASQRLSELTDDGFVADPYAPNESGMKQATRRGRIAGHHVHCYRRGQHDQWLLLVDQILDNQWDDTIHPEIIDISQQHGDLLEYISEQGPTMPTADDVPVPVDISMQISYTLEFHRLIEAADDGEGYVTTARGERVLDVGASIDEAIELTHEVLGE